MNAERFIKHLDMVADAPNTIVRLRRFILDLAVRGKLVPQDPNDEPASELLKRIAKEKARLVKAGEIRKEKLLAPVADDTVFDVPGTWRWTRLGIVTSYIQRGKSPKYAASDGSLVVSQKCVQWRGLDLSVAKQVTLESLADYEDIRFLRDGDLLWNSTPKSSFAIATSPSFGVWKLFPNTSAPGFDPTKFSGRSKTALRVQQIRSNSPRRWPLIRLFPSLRSPSSIAS
jgi:hypothetical protein